jgi:hypothetical protein
LTGSAAPRLEGDARAAVLHRGSHLQIVASAGSGKTEVVAQRFAQLMADGADPAGIIAFTFTERAADELKARISARVEERLGRASLDKLGAAFVGTIHSYCFRLLQQHVPKYETYDVLDERRLTAFLCREEPALHLKNLTGKVFTSIKASSMRHPRGGTMKRSMIAPLAIGAAVAISLAVAGPALAGPATMAALKACTASVTNSHPADYTTTDVKVRTAASAEVFTVAHYKTVNRAYYRIAGPGGRATIAYYVSGATPGYKVVVDVTVVRGHQANACSTSFTPKR